MRLSIGFVKIALVIGFNHFSNLGFMRAVSNRLPGQIFSNAFVQSIARIPYRQPAQRHRDMRIGKSGSVKSRRDRNTVTNDLNHFDQPLLYRTNPTYAMKPEVLDRIRFPREMKPAP